MTTSELNAIAAAGMEAANTPPSSSSIFTPTLSDIKYLSLRGETVRDLVARAERTSGIPGAMPLVFDNSMLTTLQRCPREFFLTHVLHYKPKEEAKPLTFGRAIHAGLETNYREFALALQAIRAAGRTLDATERELVRQGIAQKVLAAFEADVLADASMPRLKVDEIKRRPYSIERGAEILLEYMKQRSPEREEWEVESPDSVELGFAMMLGHFIFIGKLDLLARYRETRKLVVIDHKTATMMPEIFPQRFATSAQLRGYMRAVERITGEKCRDAIINAVHFNKNILEVNNQFKYNCSDAQVDEWELETMEKIAWVERMYLRWAEAVSTITGGDAEAGTGDSIHLNTSLSHPAVATFPRNPSSCTQFNRACSFLPICAENNPAVKDALARTGFDTKIWLPFEMGFSSGGSAEED